MVYEVRYMRDRPAPGAKPVPVFAVFSNVKDSLVYAYKLSVMGNKQTRIYKDGKLYGATVKTGNDACALVKVIYKNGEDTGRFSHYLVNADGSTIHMYTDAPKKQGSGTNDAGLPGLKHW